MPQGKRAVAHLGKNIEPARVARTSDTPIVGDGASATEAAARASGCGCSVAGAPSNHAWLVAAAPVLMLYSIQEQTRVEAIYRLARQRTSQAATSSTAAG